MTDTTTDAAPAPPPPDPQQDRPGRAVPPNLANILCVLATLLEYGRHLADTIERRATMPGFSLIASLFGTANLRIIHAHLQRGIMRATALESLLLMRAHAGRDVAMVPIRTRSTPGAGTGSNTENERLTVQAARLAIERAAFDAPIDPDDLPSPEQIESEVRRHPIGYSISAICRDFGIVEGACTRAFWEAILKVIVCYGGSWVACHEDSLRKMRRFHEEEAQDPAAEPLRGGGPLYAARDALGFSVGEWPIVPLYDDPMPAGPCPDVPVPEECAAVAADATGPPDSAALPARCLSFASRIAVGRTGPGSGRPRRPDSRYVANQGDMQRRRRSKQVSK